MHADIKPNPDTDRVVQVSVSTTAGFFPEEGFERFSAREKVEVALRKAAEKLKIADTNGWIASVSTPKGKREIEPSRTFAESGLAGQVEIDWGPREGGGG